MKTTLINDSQKLIAARTRFGTPIPFYDDGYGPLFVHRDSMGIDAIIRAQTWEDAYSIWEDEFAPEPDADDITEEALIKEFGEDWQDDACFQDQYGYRSNAGDKNIFYVKDLNGDALDQLNSARVQELEISLFIREFEDEEIAFVPTLPTLL